MNKKLLIFLAIITISLSFVFNIDRFINNKLSVLNNSISSYYLETLISVQSTISKYFNQLEYIDQLKIQNDQNQKYQTLYNIELNKFREIERFQQNKTLEDEYNLTKVKVLSYYKFTDHSKVILDLKDTKDNIKPLISYDGYSAGIIITKENQSVGYLNHNNKCNYAVYIGNRNAPGITSGMNQDGFLKIKFIPLWQKVQIGDEIITSGMDNIFPIGIKVAKVISIEKNENTKKVLALPYIISLQQRYFYTNN